MAFKLDNVNPVTPQNQNFADQRLFPNTPAGGGVGQTILGNFLGRGRTGVWRRQIMTWLIPNRLESIQMYINPQSVTIRKQKLINHIRTRGGFVNQYWGEEFDVMSLSGTTGSGGIEGINILDGIYRAEQSAVEGVGEALIRRLKSGNFNDFVSGDVFRNVKNIGSLLQGSSLTNSIFGKSVAGNNSHATLADIAFNVRCSFQGATYRGYFTNFSFDERAEKPGIFDYSMEFVIIETFGTRNNFMPWHRAPQVGPADNNSVPLSYSTMINGASTSTRAISEAIGGAISALAGVQGVPGSREQLLRTVGGGPDTPPEQTGRIASTQQSNNLLNSPQVILT